MSQAEYDIVTVGGGLGGAAVAAVMAKAGARVLVVERETRFQDRVRGEFMEPWGVAETRRLGIYDAISKAANDSPFWQIYLSGMKLDRRDCVATTPHNLPNLAIYHPVLQELVLAEAAKAGAEVRRGAKVREVKPGNPPTVTVESNGQVEELTPRLVVGADGRSSMVRKWCGFATQREPERYYIAGLLFEEMPAPADTAYRCVQSDARAGGLSFPARRRPRARLRRLSDRRGFPPAGRKLDRPVRCRSAAERSSARVLRGRARERSARFIHQRRSLG